MFESLANIWPKRNYSNCKFELGNKVKILNPKIQTGEIHTVIGLNWVGNEDNKDVFEIATDKGEILWWEYELELVEEKNV